MFEHYVMYNLKAKHFSISAERIHLATLGSNHLYQFFKEPS